MEYFFKYVFFMVLKTLFKIFYFFPVQNNRILFDAYGGRQYACNPKYISNYLLKMYPNCFEMYWAFRKPKDFEILKANGIKLLKYRSIKYFFIVMTSRIIIGNIGVRHIFIPYRKKQITIQTWHGSGAYKVAGFDNSCKQLSFEQIIAKKNILKVNFFISGCSKFTQCLIRKSFGATDANVLEIGTPRNDIFFTNYEKIEKKIHSYYNIANDKRILLYAPTFRKSLKNESFSFDPDFILSFLRKRFNSFNWVVMFRCHYLINPNNLNYDSSHIIDVSGYPDMQELLCATDILITDYSSCMWDFSLMYKPCFIYATDINLYEQERDFYTPMNEWPFPIATNNNELANNILNFNEDDYKNKVKKHHLELGNCETGHASEIVGDRIYKICFEHRL